MPIAYAGLFFTAVGSALVVVLLLLCLFRYYQIILTHATLQGYWHIEDDIYLIIDNNVMRVVDLSRQITYEDNNVEFNYTSILATTGHTYCVKRSPNSTFACLSDNHSLNSENILFELYPVSGIMHLKNGDKVDILTKDNEMSGAFVE